MHPLHDYVAKQLADKVKSRRVVVWYDARSEFVPFIREVRGGLPAGSEPASVSGGGSDFKLAEYAGSMFELRAAVEPYVSGDEPECVVIYLPGCERDLHGSVLMELEKAGECYQPQLKRLARNVLRLRYTDGVIDEILAPEMVAYEDLARASSDTSSTEPPSILKAIFHDVTGNDGILAAWLASDGHDAEIESKEAARELTKLVRSRLGLDPPEGTGLAKLRSITLRYVLAGEFRSDLNAAPPASLDSVPVPKTKDAERAVRDLARRLRGDFAESYPRLADGVEAELGLQNASIAADALGAIDTFRFEERALLAHCSGLIADKKFEEALRIVGEREHSFWLGRDVERKAQWEACRCMAELGSRAVVVRAQVVKMAGDANAWVKAYTEKDGWYRLDQAQRRLETWIVGFDGEEPEEKALGVVRRVYEDVCHLMAEGFSKALVKASWVVSESMHQTHIYSEVVTARPKPVAYFFVDAMRFEMGVDLADRLPESAEIGIHHAIGALPSITPIGMAALLPGASSSFSVIEQGGKPGALIDEKFLPDLPARKKFAASRVPKLVDIELNDLLDLQRSRLAKKIEGASVIIVRSSEIDSSAEGGSQSARQVMDTVIDNLARAIRRLAGAGVENAVVSADHGHLFFSSDRDESMRTDAPGGDTVDLHRRCWIGRGGATPPGCIRVAASALGYDSDLEFIFPSGCGVIKSGGSLAYHHGGASLQELIIPVLTVRMKARQAAPSTAGSVMVTGVPDKITNRIFTAMLQLGGQNLSLFSSEILVRPLLMSAGKQVGAVGMAIGAEFDQATGCVKLVPGKPVTVAFRISGESHDKVEPLRVVVQDPATDAELYRSPADIPVNLI